MRRSILLLSLMMAACATSPVDRSLTIETVSRGKAVPGASCEVRSDTISTTVTTPARLPPVTGAGDLRIVCDKPGYRTSEFLFRPAGVRTTGSSVGVGVGGGSGHVGGSVGFNFPIGSANSDYPTHVTIDMNPL